MSAQKQQALVRYYLWTDDGPWRLPKELHKDLIDRELALPQYADTKQKVLEVFARRIAADTYSLRGQGTFFSFDEKGYLKRVPAEELMGLVVERAKQKLRGGNVVSIEPTLRERRFKRELYWKATQSMLRRVRDDFQKTSKATHSRRVRVLKRPT